MVSEQVLKGEFACLKVELLANELGAIVSRPNLECRYDRIIDFNGKLYRAQIKYTASRVDGEGTAKVELRKTQKHRRAGCYKEGEVDVLLVYVAECDAICWFDPKDFVGIPGFGIRFDDKIPKKTWRKPMKRLKDHLWTKKSETLPNPSVAQPDERERLTA